MLKKIKHDILIIQLVDDFFYKHIETQERFKYNNRHHEIAYKITLYIEWKDIQREYSLECSQKILLFYKNKGRQILITHPQLTS